MNFNEMVLALLAIVFFTTIALVYNRNMWTSAENLDNASKVIQATQLAHSRLDQIDAKLFSQQLAFAAIKTSFNRSEQITLLFPDYKFTVTYVTVDCDSMGVQVATANNLYVKTTVRVSALSGLKVPVSVTRIYTKTNMNI